MISKITFTCKCNIFLRLVKFSGVCTEFKIAPTVIRYKVQFFVNSESRVGKIVGE